jgi:hypothetical protein
VLSLLEMTQLDRVFRMFSTVEEALAAAPNFRDAWERKAWEEEHAREGVLIEEPSSRSIRAGAIAAGGSLGAAALAQIIMNTPMDDELELPAFLALGDEEDDLDEDFEDDDDFDDDLDEEDEVEGEAATEEKDKPEGEEVVEPEDLDEDFEDDDWDDEELDDDEEDDY